MVPRCLGTVPSPVTQPVWTGQVTQVDALYQHPQEHVSHHNLCLIITDPQILKNLIWASPQYARQEGILRGVWGRDKALAFYMKVCQSMRPQHPWATASSASNFTSPLLHAETQPSGAERYGPLLPTPRANGQIGHMSYAQLGQVFVMCLFQRCCINLTPQAVAWGTFWTSWGRQQCLQCWVFSS